MDFRPAIRSLRRSPTFTATAIATLALGVGATTAIFSLANAVLFAPVPYPDPDRLRVLMRGAAGSAQSGQLFEYVRERVSALDVAAQRGTTSFNLVTPDTAIHVVGLRVSSGYFKTHAVTLLAGREFTGEEDLPKGPDAAIISDALWQRLFAGRVDALGNTIRLGGVTHTVVGVMPAGFRTIPAADVLVPLRLNARDQGTNNRVFGRLHKDATLAAAQTELNNIRADAIRDLNLDERNVPPFEWAAYRDVLARGLRQPMVVLLGAVGLLLLIACVNVASLNIARAITREREIATYLAMGAGRMQVIRHLFGESLIVALVSGVIGVAIAVAGTRLLFSLVSSDFARDLLSGATAALDGRVLITAMAITLGTALFFGIAPAAVLARLDLRASLGTSRSATTGRHTTRLRRGLAVAEVALALILVVGAGLLIRTFVNLASVDPGFNPRGIVVGRMSLQGTALEEGARREVLFSQALDRIRRLPGVVAAAVSNHVPVESGLNLALLPPAGGLIDRRRSVDWRYITPAYFDLFDVPMRAGREFDESDSSAGKPVAIVNEAFARTYFGRVDVVGQVVQLDPSSADPPREIVGVVGDVKARSNSGFTRGLNALASAAAPAIFVPAAQAPDSAVRIAHTFFQMKWIVRTEAPFAVMEQGMREALHAIDPTLPFVGFEPMSTIIANDLNLERLLMTLMAAFAAAAMLLAAVGLSGLVAYAAAQRRREVGVRMALGATGGSIVRSLVGEGLSVAGIGVALGALGAFFVSRVPSTFLHGVRPLDALTFAGAAVILIGVAAFAAFVPSVAAARTDPVSALRAD